MTLGELKLETLKMLDEAEDITINTLSESEYDSRMLGAINRALQTIYNENKLPITSALLSSNIILNDSEQGIIFSGIPYNTANTYILPIPQNILDLLPLGISAELLVSDNQVALANDYYNKYAMQINALKTPKINAEQLGTQQKVSSIYKWDM